MLGSSTLTHSTFLGELVEAGLLTLTGVAGVYARGAGFEAIRLGLDDAITCTVAPDQPERLLFPPILPREQLETNGYLGSFPHLAGTVFGFAGDQASATRQFELASRHEDWSCFQTMTDVVLAPAACYPLYPALAERGPLPEAGVTLDTGDAYVFRREPSSDPTRMQIFHMREIVRVGEPNAVLEWRERSRRTASDLLTSLGLDIDIAVATDPFFGRKGRFLASAQRQQQAKMELLAPICGDERTAVASSNYHRDHFGLTFHLLTRAGTVAHSSCMAFGEERIVLALFRAHGLDVGEWPREIRGELGLGP